MLLEYIYLYVNIFSGLFYLFKLSQCDLELIECCINKAEAILDSYQIEEVL